MKGLNVRVLVCVIGLLPASIGTAGELGGIGVLGDSYSDEYQFYSPDRATARNWVEILAEVRGFDFGRFSTVNRGEPLNQGYAYNWARSDATTTDLIRSGQHTGLAQQVASGKVNWVVIFIGGNDFIHALESADPASELSRVLPEALSNYRKALGTILQASPNVRVVSVTIPDIRHLPLLRASAEQRQLPQSLLDQYGEALAVYNSQIRNLALNSTRVAVADFDAADRFSSRLSRTKTVIGGHRLDRLGMGNSVEHLFLADGRHLGTIGQGFMAQLIVNAIASRFHEPIPLLTNQEIDEFAQSLEKTRESLVNLEKRSE